jgi:hypothetical protein
LREGVDNLPRNLKFHDFLLVVDQLYSYTVRLQRKRRRGR